MDREFFVEHSGKITERAEESITVSRQDIDCTYLKAFRNSIHSFQREITRGYITIQGGHRVGFCGTAVLDGRENYSVMNLKDISSVNIRVAREIKDCGKELFGKIIQGDKIKSLLIAGAPSSGKTTVLRDLTRLMGNRFSVSLIDERNEISSVFGGVPQNDVGVFTDIFDSYNKYEGIMTAVKVMSPKVLVCDEIGGDEDLRALDYCLNSGVRLVATCHADSVSDALERFTVKKLLEHKGFDCIVFLGNGEKCGKITDFMEYGDKND